MMRCFAWLAVLLVMPLCSGCVVGYDSVLFATKSNIGFDFDSAPPTAELAISRVEGVIEPTFEGGRTLPVMASFKVRGDGLFAGGVGQTFTTGEAAVIMATLYGDAFSKQGESLDWEDDVEKKFQSALVLDSEPKINIKDVEFAREDVRPVFFGTTTSLGLKVSWSGLSGPNPDSLHLGYKRKELAWAPVSMKVEEAEDDDDADPNGADDSDEEQWHMRVPSLLATIDAAGDVGKAEDVEFNWLQYFATGRAASALALRKEVRSAMLRRLDPEAAQSLVATYGSSEASECIDLWLKQTAAQDPNPRRTTLQSFINDDLSLNMSVTFWLNSAGEPGRAEQYQAFIDREDINCDELRSGGS